MINRVKFLIVICCISFSSFGQSIKGKISLNENWKPVVYLIEISNYSMLFTGSSDNVVDSFYVSTEGYFYFEHLKPDALYRLNVIPISSDVPGALIQDGDNDNYSLFATNRENKSLYFVGDITKLFRSGKTISSDNSLNELQKQIVAINATKLPIYDLMASLGKEMDKIPESDTAKLQSFQQGAIPQIMRNNTETNVSLLKYLQQIKNPEVLSFGLINYDFETNYADKGIRELIQRLKQYPGHLLAKSIVDRVKELSHGVEHSFFRQEYGLINGGNIKLDTIQSRFILMDFWASWCLPCRKAIRNELKELGSRYKKEDFQIIGINIDQNKQNAILAIERDGNKNIQIWDGGNNELHQIFKVKAIPHYILIDSRTKNIEVLKETITLGNKLDALLKSK